MKDQARGRVPRRVDPLIDLVVELLVHSGTELDPHGVWHTRPPLGIDGRGIPEPPLGRINTDPLPMRSDSAPPPPYGPVGRRFKSCHRSDLSATHGQRLAVRPGRTLAD